MNSNKVKNYISTQLGTEADINIQAFKAGASNLTYQVTAGKQTLIIRTSPPGTKAQGAHNMAREFNWLSALHPSYPLCPKPLFLCQDKAVFERDFYAMTPVTGDIIRQQVPSSLQNEQPHELCQSLIKTQYQLHHSNSQAVQSFNKGPGYIERQISGWINRYDMVRPKSDQADALMKWLQNNLPMDNRNYCPIHNDFKFDNVVFSPNSSAITGVLDWELATVGDPLMDLGCSLAYWVEANDSDAMKKVAMMPTYMPGMMTRDELLAYYCELSGDVIDNPSFYYIYGLFRLAVIAQQIYFRYENGQNPNPAFAHLGKVRDLMILQALKKLN